MKGHVTIERTKKSIKIQEVFYVLAISFGFLLFLVGGIGENGFYIGMGLFCVFTGVVWKLFFIRLQKWWHHG